MNSLRVARLRPEALLPTRKHPADAGLDIYAVDSAQIAPHSMAILHTGITLEIPPGTVGLLKPKGGNDHLVGAGVIDAGYQGEILVKVVNPYDSSLDIRPGMAIAQLLLIAVETPPVAEVDAVEIHTQVSSRGASGGIVDQSG